MKPGLLSTIWTAGASFTGAATGPPGRSLLKGGATIDPLICPYASLDDHLGDGEKILNTTTARHWLIRGGLFHALHGLQRVRPCPYTPRQLPTACMASYGQQAAIFAPVASRAGERPKRKTSAKAIYRPVTALYTLMAIPIFPHRKTAHRSRQRPAQGIKQPRPAPLWSKPGFCQYRGKQAPIIGSRKLYKVSV